MRCVTLGPFLPLSPNETRALIRLVHIHCVVPPLYPSRSKTPRKRIPSRYASISAQYSKQAPWRTALRAISAWMSKVFTPGTCVAECQYTSVGEGAKRRPEQAASETAALRKRHFAYLYRKTTTTMEQHDDGDNTTVERENRFPPWSQFPVPPKSRRHSVSIYETKPPRVIRANHETGQPTPATYSSRAVASRRGDNV